MKILLGVKKNNKIKFKAMTDGTSITVRNSTERLALSADEVENIEVIDGDTQAAWRLYKGTDPSVPENWFLSKPIGSILGINKILLNSVTANTTSAAVDVAGLPNVTVYVTASNNPTLGARFYIDSLSPSSTWIEIHDQLITSNGTTAIVFRGAFTQVRLRVGAYQNGTFSASLSASK